MGDPWKSRANTLKMIGNSVISMSLFLDMIYTVFVTT
jgi:hypothetical protein